MQPRLFVFGLGYSAGYLAHRLRAEGWRVAGTTRQAEKRDRLAAEGIDAFLFDRDRPLEDASRALAGTTHLLSSVPPDRAGDPVLDRHGDDIAAQASLRWVGYLSTTGVYGDAGGGWVDEETAPAPLTDRGRARLAAEEGWLNLWRHRGVPVHRFRLPGIYGPGRSALDSLRSGTARRIDKPGQVFSRIHVEDIAGVLRASMDRPRPGAVYNVVDDEPAPAAEVVAFAAALLGMPSPPLEPFDPDRLSPMAASFYGESKRVSNRRIKEELGVGLRHPTYREGLRALLPSAAKRPPDR